MVKLEDFWSTYLWATILIAIVVIVLIVILVLYCLRKRRRRGYEPLQGSSEVDTFLMTSSIRSKSVEEETSMLNCQYYLRAHPEYELNKPLPDIGSRLKRSWFSVSRNGIPRLMFFTEKSKTCRFTFDSTIERTLQSLMHVLDHPYLLPIEHIGLSNSMNRVIMVEPLARKGSLKDLLYKVQPLQPWDEKYSKRRSGLNEKKIIIIARQILEAVDYLKKQGIPCHHLHSGNIIMMNDIPKLTGFENYLFGYSARQRDTLSPIIKAQPKEKRHRDILTVLMFGHLLYEMSCGVEVQEAKPSMSDITNNCPSVIQSILANIFYHPEERIPTLMEVQSHSCFVNVRLHEFKEMKEYSPKPFVMSTSMKKLLSAIKKKKPIRGLSRRHRSRGSSQGQRILSTSSYADSNSSFNTHETSLNSSALNNSALNMTTTSTASTSFSSPPSNPPQPPQQQQPSSSSGRGALLSSIRQGAALKKAETNDRSAPSIQKVVPF